MLDPNRRQKRVFYGAFFPVCFFFLFFLRLVCAVQWGKVYADLLWFGGGEWKGRWEGTMERSSMGTQKKL